MHPKIQQIVDDLNNTYSYMADIGADDLELRRFNETIEEIKELGEPNSGFLLH